MDMGAIRESIVLLCSDVGPVGCTGESMKNSTHFGVSSPFSAYVYRDL